MVVRHRLFAAVLVTAVLFSGVSLLHATWIPVKAEVAQWLIKRSWERVRTGDMNARPWPWADTRAAGVLSVPDLGIRQVVLQGNSGRNLAFGPVMLDHSDGGQDRVLSGHRDTHFRFLEKLQHGDLLTFSTAEREVYYRVAFIDVVDSSETQIIIDPSVKRLSLVTCYPFDSLDAGGPLRYVVTALPIANGFRPPPPPTSSG